MWEDRTTFDDDRSALKNTYAHATGFGDDLRVSQAS